MRNFIFTTLIIVILIGKLFSQEVIVPKKIYTGIYIESIYRDILITQGDRIKGMEGYDRDMNLLWAIKYDFHPYSFIIDNNGYRYSVRYNRPHYFTVLNVADGNKTERDNFVRDPGKSNDFIETGGLSDKFFITDNKVLDYNFNVLWDAVNIIPDNDNGRLLSSGFINNNGNILFNNFKDDNSYLMSQNGKILSKKPI